MVDLPKSEDFQTEQKRIVDETYDMLSLANLNTDSAASHRTTKSQALESPFMQL